MLGRTQSTSARCPIWIFSPQTRTKATVPVSGLWPYLYPRYPHALSWPSALPNIGGPSRGHECRRHESCGHSRVEHIDPHTVHRWLERATTVAKCFNDTMIHNLTLQELQADELQAIVPVKTSPTWIFTTIEVWSRLWVSTIVGARTAENIQQLLQDTALRGALTENSLITTDGFQPYVCVIRAFWGNPCVYAQVVKTMRNNRIIKVVQKLIIGTANRLGQALMDSEDSTTVNTSFIERLNLTIRQCCAYLGCRQLSHARRQVSLANRLELVRCFYNFIRPHRSLKFGKIVRTPVMQAGLATWRLRFFDIFRSAAVRMKYGVSNSQRH